MADLFKEYDSSSSESGDDANKPHQDDMLFESNNIIPLSKDHHHQKILNANNQCRATSGLIARG